MVGYHGPTPIGRQRDATVQGVWNYMVYQKLHDQHRGHVLWLKCPKEGVIVTSFCYYVDGRITAGIIIPTNVNVMIVMAAGVYKSAKTER